MSDICREIIMTYGLLFKRSKKGQEIFRSLTLGKYGVSLSANGIESAMKTLIN